MKSFLRYACAPILVILACDSSTGSPLSPDAGLNVPDGATGDGSALDGSSDLDGNTEKDASVGDTSVDAPPPPPTFDWYVNPVTGLDTNDGKTEGTPFKTLCKVATVIQADQWVGLADGSYDDANQRPIGWVQSTACGPTFSVTTRLAALHAGLADVKVGMIFANGGEARGLKLETDRTVLGGTASVPGQIQVNAGTMTIRGLTLGDVFSQPNAKKAPLVVGGTSKVTLFPDGVANYAAVPVPNGAGFTFAIAQTGTELTMEGGSVDDSAQANADPYCNPLFEGSGTITLKNMTVRHKGSVARSYGKLVIQGGTLDDRSVALNTGCFPSIEIFSAVDVTIANATLGGGTSLGMQTVTFATGTINISGSTFAGFTNTALDLTGAGSPLAVTVRGTTLQNNGIGVALAGTTTLDLGTNASPGNNVLVGNSTHGVAHSATGTVQAVGNTWTASQQGADAAGKYTAALKAGPDTGLNYSLPGGSQSIQF